MVADTVAFLNTVLRLGLMTPLLLGAGICGTIQWRCSQVGSLGHMYSVMGCSTNAENGGVGLRASPRSAPAVFARNSIPAISVGYAISNGRSQILGR